MAVIRDKKVHSVAVKDLKEGWVLSEDVRDINGRLMLSKGQQINFNHIKILKIWGISDVWVDMELNPPLHDKKELDVEKRRRSENTLQMILQNSDISHTGIQAIFQSAVDYRYHNNNILAIKPHTPLPPNFKLDLSKGLKTQIDFSNICLPETPAIILDLNEVLEDPKSSVNDVADVVNRSPSLAALLLKMANSAFYGFTSKTDTISRAVNLIGTREVSSLLTAIASMRLFNNIPADLIDMCAFLRHSLSCGILSRILAAQKNLVSTERLFVAGLLHDIGRLVLYKYFSEQARLILSVAEKTGTSLYEIEKKCLGINHEQIAGYMLRKWKLPIPLVKSIAYHHSPNRYPDSIEADIVHLADITVNALGLGHSGEHIIPCFDTQAWEKINLPPSAIKTAINQTIQQLEIMEIIFSEL